MTDNYSTRARGHLRAKVTRLCNKVDDVMNVLTPREVAVALANLEKWSAELKILDEKIGSKICISDSDSDSDVLEREWESCDDYEQRITEAQETLRRMLTLEQGTPGTPTVTALTSDNLRQTKLKLPELPLPTFSNLPDETLNHFLDNFESVINKYNLSE